MSKDKFSGLKFHIESQDYFGTLATIISLNQQFGSKIPQTTIDELMFLQNNYKIVKTGDL